MKKIQYITIVLLYGLICLLAGQERYCIDRDGKVIQVDGFLIEWNSENSDTLAGALPVIWDAINTPQGIAGYIRYSGNDSCLLKTVKIYPDMHKMHLSITMLFDTTSSASGFYAFEKSQGDTSFSIISEWLIPWDTISVDSLNNYDIGFVATDNCGNSIKPLILYGKRPGEAKNRIFTTKVNVQIISILILLLLFLRLRARARKLNVKRDKKE